jgi:hypothetical protein
MTDPEDQYDPFDPSYSDEDDCEDDNWEGLRCPCCEDAWYEEDEDWDDDWDDEWDEEDDE